jgi:hypothetical protein
MYRPLGSCGFSGNRKQEFADWIRVAQVMDSYGHSDVPSASISG